MKELLKKAYRPLISLVLVLCLLVGMSANGLIVLAKGNDDKPVTKPVKKPTIHYVSLGDSMTNGYGLPGYDANSGVEDYGNGSYANQFADWLVEAGYAGEVDHAQLAMSGIRAEDLHWLLELDYNDQAAIDLIQSMIENQWDKDAWNAMFSTGDFWTLDQICDHTRLDATYNAIKAKLPADYVCPTTYVDGSTRSQKVALVAKYFQEHVTEADIISMGMGNGNFGVFMLGRLLEAVEFGGTADEAMIYEVESAIRELSPAMQAQILKLIDELYVAVEDVTGPINREDDEVDTMEAIANTVVYTAVSFMIHYAGSVEAVLQHNPDAEIILVALMNTYKDQTEVEGITMGDVLGAVYDPMNTFIAALPTVMQATNNATYANAKFYYAEADKVECMVDVYEELIQEEGSVVRDRFLEDIVGTAGDPGMIWALLQGQQFQGMELVFVTMDDVRAYEANPEAMAIANPQMAMSVAVYLGFESAILDSSDAAVTVESLLALGNLDASIFAPVLADFLANLEANKAPYTEAMYVEMTNLLCQELEEQVKSMLNMPDADVQITMPYEMVAALVNGEPNAAEAVAERVIAAVVKVIRREMVAQAEIAVPQAIDAYFAAVEMAVASFGVSVDLTLEGYYSVICSGELNKAILASHFYLEFLEEDGQELPVDNRFGWLCSYVNAELQAAGCFFLDASTVLNAVYEADAATEEKLLHKAVAASFELNQDNAFAAEAQAMLEDVLGADPVSVLAPSIQENVPAIREGADALCLLQAVPETLSASLVKDETIKGLLSLYGRCMIGNGLGAHPSQAGHDALFKSVKYAYAHEYTAQDELISKIDFINKYIMNLGLQIDAVLNENLAQIVKDMQADLKVLYVQLEGETLALNQELNRLTNEELVVLEQMNAERKELVRQLEELKAELAKLQGSQNARTAGYGTMANTDPVALAEELKAAIAETEAAIVALDASIAALNAKIEADLQGIAHIQDSIAKIKAEILDTQAALDELNAALEVLNADLQVLYEASLVLADAAYNVYGMTLAQVDAKAVVAAVATVMDLVTVVEQEMNDVYNKTLVAMDKVEASAQAIETILADMQDEVAAIVNGLETLEGIEAEKLAAIKQTVAVFQQAVNGFVSEYRPALEQALKQTRVELDALALEQKVLAETWVRENQETIAYAVAMAYLYLENNGYLDMAREVVLLYTEMVEEYMQKLELELEKTQNWLEQQMPKAEQELKDRLNALKAELAKVEADLLKDADAETIKLLQKAKAQLLAQIAEVETMLSELELKVQKAQQYLQNVNAALAEARVALDDVVAAAQVVGADLVVVWNALCNLSEELYDLHQAVAELTGGIAAELKVILEYCDEVAKDLVAVLKTLPAYAKLLKNAADMLVADVMEWKQFLVELNAQILELADRLSEVLTEEQVRQMLMYLVEKYGPVVAEQLLDMLVYMFLEYGHDVAVAFYYFLYDHPYEVIEFFNEYGDLIWNLTLEYGPYVLAVIGYALSIYGEELAAYIIENPEQILANIIYWGDIHNDKMMALLQVYAEALGWCDVVREQIAELENALAEMEAEINAAIERIEKELLDLNAQLQDLYAQLENAADELKAHIEAKIAEIEAKIAQLKAQLLELNEKLQNMVAEAKAAIAELKAALVEALEKGLTDLENLKQAIKNLDEKVQALIGAAKNAAIEELKAAIEALEQAIADLDAAIAQLVGEIYQDLIQALRGLAEYLIDEMVEAIKQYAPELADEIYNYLYNHVEEVIAFLMAHSEMILQMVKELGMAALAVVAYALYMYGAEIAAFFVENYKTIVAAIVNWAKEHGENFIALIQVYAEALGLCDAIRDQIAALEAALAELEKQINDKIAQIEQELRDLEAQLKDLYAQLENAADELKAHIEAKIAEIEAKIAQLKAQLLELNEKLQNMVAEVKAAIAELKAELQKALEKGLVSLENLKRALEDLEQKVLALIDAAKNAAVEEFHAAIEALRNAMCALKEAACQLIGEAHEKLMEALWEGMQWLVDEMIEAIKQYAPELADAIYNYLYNNAEEVIAFFMEYGDCILQILKEMGKAALAIIAYTLYMYGAEVAAFFVENYELLINSIIKWAEIHGENFIALLQVYAEALGLCDAVREQIDLLNAQLDALKRQLEELKQQLLDANEAIKAEIEEQIAKIEAMIEKIEEALAELEAKLQKLYQDVLDMAEAVMEAVDAIIELHDIIAGKVEGSVEEAIAKLKQALDRLGDLVNVVSELVEKIEMLIDELQVLAEKISDLIEQMQEMVQQIKDAILEMNEKVEKILAQIEQTIEQIENTVEQLVEMTEQALIALKKAVMALIDAVNAVIKAIKDAVAELYNTTFYADYVVSKESYYVSLGDTSAIGVDNEDSTSFAYKLAQELGLDVDAQYAQLAMAGMRPTDLRYILDENFIPDEYTNRIGTIDQIRADYLAELAKADLITISMGNGTFNDFVTAQMNGTIAGIINEDLAMWLNNPFYGRVIKNELSKYVDLTATSYEMDWVSYIGEDGVEILEDVLNTIRENAIANGVEELITIDVAEAIGMKLPAGSSMVINIPAADLVAYMAECYLYAYVTYEMDYIAVYDLLQEVAPDALVVLVGMYNPMDEMVLTLGDMSIEMGQYYNYFTDILNLHHIYNAVHNENTIFVDVPETESIFDESLAGTDGEISVVDFVMNNLTGVMNYNPTADGHTYIKDEIMNHLNVSYYGLLGDINLDGKVTSSDVNLLYRYIMKDVELTGLQLYLANLNEDGKVSCSDLNILYRYVMKDETLAWEPSLARG